MSPLYTRGAGILTKSPSRSAEAALPGAAPPGDAIGDRRPGTWRVRHEAPGAVAPPVAERSPPDASGNDDSVVALLRRLIRVTTDGAATVARRHGVEADDVLLDAEIDGVRCLLVRVPDGDRGSCAGLSPREQEIARMVAKGYTNKTIAAVLDISVWTVSTYLRRIFGKLGVSSRASLVAKFLEQERSVHRTSAAPVRLD